MDYDVIPLTIADGCLYHCRFCCVKSDRGFQRRSRESILEQIGALKNHFSADLVNYHGLFLGNHDGLAAGPDLICFAARKAYQALGFRMRADQNPFLFLFGSVDSLLNSGPAVFDTLYDRIEITGNFIAGDRLSAGHDNSLVHLLETPEVPNKSKGAIYLSPLKDSPKKRELLARFYKIKKESRLPLFIYLIQRL